MNAPSTTERPPVRTEIAGIGVRDLVERFGTPTYVYDAATIRQRIADLAAFDVVRFAQKACSNIAILDVVRRAGAVVDAVSAGEIHRARVAGYAVKAEGDAPEPIVYTADIFDAESIDLVLETGVHVNCGSIDMIAQYGQRLRAAGREGGEVTLRLNPGFGHGHTRKVNTGGEGSKHGIWHADLDDALSVATEHGLTVTGIHVHIGSGTDLEHLARVTGAVEELALRAGPTVTTISGGGGLPIPYRDGDERIDLVAFHERWNATRDRLVESFGHPVRLEIEPGRYLVAEAGFLVTEVRARKTMGTNPYVLVDAGFNNLARPVLYGAYHPISVVPAGVDGAERPMIDVVVGGPLCESGDIFTQEDGGYVRTQSIAEVSVGEHLVLECAGAYGMAMASNYNSKPLAAEVLIDGGEAHEVRRRQTPEDLVALESIPGHGGGSHDGD